MGAAKKASVSASDVAKAAGSNGSNAKGVAKYGASKSAATEAGNWSENDAKSSIGDDLVELQKNRLSEIEEKMGDGGSKIEFHKKNLTEVVGAEFNDLPSIRVDMEGRSHPIEKLITDKGIITNYDSTPVVEKVDNDSSFPCGVKSVTVGNRYTVRVGSGGFEVRSTGGITMSGTSVDIAGKDVYIEGSYNMHIFGENGIEIASKEAITIRTNRQVFLQGSVGVHRNLIVGSGAYIDGELYCHHITAPIEIQETEHTEVTAKFNTDENRKLPIGEVFNQATETWDIVYAYANPDLIMVTPHSHHFVNIPIRVAKSDERLRQIAHDEGINSHGTIVPAQSVYHERKRPQ